VWLLVISDIFNRFETVLECETEVSCIAALGIKLCRKVSLNKKLRCVVDNFAKSLRVI